MAQQRIRTQDIPVARREIPIGHLRVSATTSGAAETLLTVRAGVLLKVMQLAVNNTTGTAATLNLNSIPSGDSIGDANAEFVALSVPANTAADLTPYIGQMYEEAAVIKAYAGTTNALVLHGWAEEIL